MTSKAMGWAVESDPQFIMPARPRFLTELVAVPVEEGMLLDGTDEQQFLRGPAIKSVLPQLIPLLDGTRSIDQLANSLPHLPLRAVHNATALLYTRGLLEDSAADPRDATDRFAPHSLAFFRRHVDATRVNRSGAEAFHRLSGAEAAVYAVGPHAETYAHFLSCTLLNAGVGSSSIVNSYSDLQRSFSAGAHPKARLLAVLIEGAEDTSELERLDDECAALGIPWVRAVVAPEMSTADLGPYFERGETACYRCFAEGNNGSERNEPGKQECVNGPAAYLHGRAWADMLATEVIYILSRIAPMATRNNVSRYNLSTWNAKSLRVHRQPDCVLCRGYKAQTNSIGKSTTSSATVLAYEDAVAFPSRHLLDPKAHQVHYRASNVELANQGKRYPSAERIPLPPGPELPPPAGDSLAHIMNRPNGDPPQRLTLPRLASLLLLTAGIDRRDGHTKSKVRRWAPTGGNLGSVELYIAVRDVEGLPPAIYFYQAHEHLLARLTHIMGDDEIDRFIQHAAPSKPSTGALLLFAAAHHRVAQKYGAFAYRLTQLDAGVAQAQTQVVANALGLSAGIAKSWSDDAIMSALDLVPFSEIITGVVYLDGSKLKGGELR